MRAYDNGCFYSCSVSANEVYAFNRTWPCANLPHDKSIWFQFDKCNGDLVDVDPGNQAHQMKQDPSKPIAYQRNHGNEIVHIKCWEQFRHNHAVKNWGQNPGIGSIYYPGAEKLDGPIYNKVCAQCGFSFELSVDGCRWLRLTTHADNGWQYHYPR